MTGYWGNNLANSQELSKGQTNEMPTVELKLKQPKKLTTHRTLKLSNQRRRLLEAPEGQISSPYNSQKIITADPSQIAKTKKIKSIQRSLNNNSKQKTLTLEELPLRPQRPPNKKTDI